MLVMWEIEYKVEKFNREFSLFKPYYYLLIYTVYVHGLFMSTLSLLDKSLSFKYMSRCACV